MVRSTYMSSVYTLYLGRIHAICLSVVIMHDFISLGLFCTKHIAKTSRVDLTRFNKIAIQRAPQMAVDKEATSLSRVYSYYSKCNLPFFYV